MRPARRFCLATLVLALFATEVGAQAPLRPELERAAEAQAMMRACREFRPELAEEASRAFEGWWERNSQVADAVHALHFGAPSPERTAQRQAFEALQERLLTNAERSQAMNLEAFAERCRRFIEGLERGSPNGPEPLGARGTMG